MGLSINYYTRNGVLKTQDLPNFTNFTTVTCCEDMIVAGVIYNQRSIIPNPSGVGLSPIECQLMLGNCNIKDVSKVNYRNQGSTFQIDINTFRELSTPNVYPVPEITMPTLKSNLYYYALEMLAYYFNMNRSDIYVVGNQIWPFTSTLANGGNGGLGLVLIASDDVTANLDGYPFEVKAGVPFVCTSYSSVSGNRIQVTGFSF